MPLVTLGSGDHAQWFSAGGRGVDTAYDYGDASQKEVGAAVRGSSVPRQELFVTTKIPCCPAPYWCDEDRGWWQWPDVKNQSGHALAMSGNAKAMALHNFEMLGLDYVDLMILHFPCCARTPPVATRAARSDRELARCGRSVTRALAREIPYARGAARGRQGARYRRLQFRRGANRGARGVRARQALGQPVRLRRWQAVHELDGRSRRRTRRAHVGGARGDA